MKDKNFSKEKARNKILEQKKREGYVLHKNYKSLVSDDYRGGFSEKVFMHPYLSNYIKSNGVFGYIGHSVRKVMLDKYIEKKFLSLKPKKLDVDLVLLLAIWLTSTDGRHFGDYLEGYSLKKQKELIDSNIKNMFNKAYIYNLPEHNGTYKSSLELEETYKGKLL